MVAQTLESGGLRVALVLLHWLHDLGQLTTSLSSVSPCIKQELYHTSVSCKKD